MSNQSYHRIFHVFNLHLIHVVNQNYLHFDCPGTSIKKNEENERNGADFTLPVFTKWDIKKKKNERKKLDRMVAAMKN